MNQVIKEKMLEKARALFPNITGDLETFIRYKAKTGFPFGNLTSLHYKVFGGSSKEIVNIAAAIEIMILALDIFDDLEDEDNPSAPWTNCSPPLSMNIATGLLMLSHQIFDHVNFPSPSLFNAKTLFNKLTIHAVNGQHVDLQNSIYNEEDYLYATKLKSGALVAAACTTGAALTNTTHLNDIQKYGITLGVCAQIKNDLQDIVRPDLKNDLIFKKKTLPALYLIKHNKIIRDYYNESIPKEQFSHLLPDLIEPIKKSGALEYGEVILRLQQQKAHDMITKMALTEDQKEELITSLIPK